MALKCLNYEYFDQSLREIAIYNQIIETTEAIVPLQPQRTYQRNLVIM